MQTTSLRHLLQLVKATTTPATSLRALDRCFIHKQPSWSVHSYRGHQARSVTQRSEGVKTLVRTYAVQEDTIAAVVTGMQKAAVAIVRVSGLEAISIARNVFRSRSSTEEWTPETHRVYFGDVVGSDGTTLDEILCLVFLSPHSYTAEDVVELHCHGGTVSVQRILSACIQAGARTARPGEFTLRAFLNGKMDLSQAESVAQLIDSRTVGAADSALAGLKGGIGQTIQSLRDKCLEMLGELEARLDFDEDMPELDTSTLKNAIQEMQTTVESCLRTATKGRLLHNGLQIAIVGRPNVGKSSLMNAWSGMNKAIVTEIPGTTRDVIQAELSIHGVPVTLLDTAGIREGSEVVEKMGIERAAATARSADLIVMVMDVSEGWTDSDAMVFKSLWGNGTRIIAPGILVANKADKTTTVTKPSLPLIASESFVSVVRTSALEQTGIEDLDAAVVSAVENENSVLHGGVAWAVNERQSEALFRVHASLERVVESMEDDMPMDLWTIDLRDALLALGEVSGEDVKEEILDNVFSRFCIGK